MELLKPTVISMISTKHDIKKTSALLLITKGDELLLQKIDHQAAIIYDAFGTFVDSIAGAEAQIMKVQKENFGSSLKVESAGNVVAYIDKPQPDGRVQLTTAVYRLKLNQNQASKLLNKHNYIWLNAKAIQESELIREDDKLIFNLALSDQKFNIIMDVNQHGQWINAKLLAWARFST